MLGYRKPMSLIPLFFLFFLSLLHFSAFAAHDRSVVKLDLLHRHHPQVSQRLHGHANPQALTDRLKDMHDHDHNRHRTISASLFRNKIQAKMTDSDRPDSLPPSPTPIGLKMHSGSDWGSGEYFVHLKVGTPPQSFMLIADTGSDLTWMKCRYRRCIGNCTASRIKNRYDRRMRFSKAFLANRSSSFKTIDCSSKACKVDFSNLFSIVQCPTPTSPCVYDYSYAGGSSALGIFANETITVGLTDGTEAELHDSLIGCTESVQGRAFGGSDGVLGLGSGPYSFIKKASEHSNGGFSYCLVDHLSFKNATNYFILGAPTSRIPSISAPKMAYTKLFLGGIYSSFYGLDLVGISSDGVMLKIPPRVWDVKSGGGTIIDSGTSLTMLSTPAYDRVMEVLVPPLSTFERVEMHPFAFCFNNTKFSFEMAPKLRFHFSDGAVFEPPAKSYVITVGKDISCIGFLPIAFPASNIIGNIVQQNHLWQFDFLRGRVGFAPSECL